MASRYMDYHMHTAVTIDGKMTEVQACERALAAGVTEIAFTNHSMLTEPEYDISVPAMVQHWQQIQDCQRRCPELTIRLGLELDYYPGREEEIADVVTNHENAIGRPFDLVLGAVHHMHGVFFSNRTAAPELFQGADTVALYRDYFQLATRAVHSGLYDVMAHPDLIKKYTDVFSPRVPFQAYREAAESFIDALLARSIGIELNTKGLTRLVNEIYPSDEFLALYLEHARASDVDPIITFGSDAHKVEDVGARLPQAEQALRRAGSTVLTRFEHRRRMAHPLGEPNEAG